MIFNYGRNEVRNFLVSNALFWLDKYHIDGLARRRRGLDALPGLQPQGRASGFPMSTAAAKTWRRSLLLSEFNEQAHGNYPGVLTIAEESTAWPRRLASDLHAAAWASA